MPSASEGNSQHIEDKDFKEKLEGKQKQRQLFAWLSATLGMVAATISLLGAFPLRSLLDTQRSGSVVLSPETQRTIASMTESIAEMQKELQISRELVDRIKSSPPAGLQIARLSVQLDSLQNRMKMLDDAIGTSPDKSL